MFSRKRAASLLFLASLPLLSSLLVHLWMMQYGGSPGHIRVDANFQVELKLMGKVFHSRRSERTVPLEQIPNYLIEFLLFQEDQTFFSHNGYSLREIYVTWKDFLLKGHRLRGASTITQQLARTLFLGRQKSLRRKFIELRIARLLESHLSKEEILELYLNHVYWGHSAYGLAMASLLYFDTLPILLTRKQAAFLISILPTPTACSKPYYCNNPTITRRMERLTNRAGSTKPGQGL